MQIIKLLCQSLKTKQNKRLEVKKQQQQYKIVWEKQTNWRF